MASTAHSQLPVSGRLLLLVTLLFLIAWSCPVDAASEPRILLLTKTSGFAHGSIPTAVSAIRKIAEADGFVVDDTADASLFSDADSNGDGIVNALDLGAIKANFFAAPGPSGQVTSCGPAAP